MIRFFYSYSWVAFVLLTLLSSCASRKQIAYFQEIQSQAKWDLSPSKVNVVLTPHDKVSIIVNSKDPALSSLFNLPIVSHRVVSGELQSINSSQQLSLYTLDDKGDIDFPILGKLHLAGLTREETASKIKATLSERALLKDPTVIVEFANLSFSVLGEVNKPGRHSIDKDKLTLLDAIGIAGDLTIYGKRDNVLVIKSDNGTQHTYRVDLRSLEGLINSPAYYIQQNDIIYIEPNSMRVGQSTVNGNSFRSSAFWLSLLSLGATITLFLLRK